MGPNNRGSSIKTKCVGCQNVITIDRANVEKELHCTICGTPVDPRDHPALGAAIADVQQLRHADQLQAAEERERLKREKQARRLEENRRREASRAQKANEAKLAQQNRARAKRLQAIATRINSRRSSVAESIVVILLAFFTVGFIWMGMRVFINAESAIHEILGALFFLAAAVVGCCGILLLFVSQAVDFFGNKLDAVCDLLRWQGGLAEDDAEAEALRGRVRF